MSRIERPKTYEILPQRLQYLPVHGGRIPRDTPTTHYFSIDNTLVYWPFFLDFGPLNLGQLYRFCEQLNAKLADPKLAGKTIVYISDSHANKRANAVYLITAFSLLYLGKTPAEAWAPFASMFPPLPSWHDASPVLCTYQLGVQDCLDALQKAKDLNFFNFEKFDVRTTQLNPSGPSPASRRPPAAPACPLLRLPHTAC